MKSTLVILSALAISASAFAGSDMKSKSSSSSEMKSEVKVSEITRNPQKFLNKTVTVSGEVEKMGSDNNSFVLDGEGMMNDQILVIKKGSMDAKATSSETGPNDRAMNETANTDVTSAGSTTASTSGSAALKEDDEVRLSGTVRRLSAADIERAYSLELDSSLKDEMKGALPVIVADAKTFQLMRAK